MTDFPRGKYDKLTVTPEAPKSKPMIWGFVPEKDFPYPVMPTYKVQLDYTNSTGLFTDLLETAESNGSFYWVTACPTSAGLQFMRTAQEQGAQQQARAEKLAAAVHDPLLSKLKALLAAQDKIGAITAYRKATGVDLTTAVNVIDILEGQKYALDRKPPLQTGPILVRPLELDLIGSERLRPPGADIADLAIGIVVPTLPRYWVGDRFAELVRTGRRQCVKIGQAAETSGATRIRHDRIKYLTVDLVVVAAKRLARLRGTQRHDDAGR
jgi:hypothetical protein